MSFDVPGRMLLAQVGPGGGLQQFIPLVLILVVFYFLLVRPQQQRAKQHDEFVAGLKRNDKVITGSGMYAKVVEVHDKDVTLEIAPNVRVRYERAKIGARQEESKEG